MINQITVQRERGHYNIYAFGDFYCSADNITVQREHGHYNIYAFGDFYCSADNLKEVDEVLSELGCAAPVSKCDVDSSASYVV